MSEKSFSKELVVLVADIQQEKTLDTLLSHRNLSLGIRRASYQIYRHPRKDAGVFGEADSFLRPFLNSHRYALVLLDAAWDGAPGNARYLQDDLMRRLCANGWNRKRCQVIVIDPELETWIWSESEEVPRILRTTWNIIKITAQKHGYWAENETKPSHPKELLEILLISQKRPRSSSLFQNLARNVGLSKCQDPAFVLLRATLQQWFPPT